jgi:hypothetical protein
MNLAVLLFLLVQQSLQFALPTSAVDVLEHCVGRDCTQLARSLWRPERS